MLIRRLVADTEMLTWRLADTENADTDTDMEMLIRKLVADMEARCCYGDADTEAWRY